jgi:hypothetical protein
MLNNLDVSSEYILRLKSEIEAKACDPKSAIAASNNNNNSNNNFMFVKVEDRDKIKPAITDLLELSKRFKQALEVWLSLNFLFVLYCNCVLLMSHISHYSLIHLY